MVVVSGSVISIFLDSVCEAVEAKHYPERRNARSQPILEAVYGAIKFLGITILVNLIALPIYLILLVAFGTGAFLFLFVNGYLVGREFFELVAARRMPMKPAQRLRKAYAAKFIVFGVLSVLLMSIPVVNLIAPVLVAAAAVHLYESLPRKAEFEAMAD
ncbi:MAG: EI24 domain-containing protein [Alphaproteobacteria bacterium]|nr:EI24 domain-containing protein [Alphaproteobacteria bacterium]